MTYSHSNVFFMCIFFLTAATIPAFPAWLIDTDTAYTWGLSSNMVSIPVGSIPVGATLTLHHVYSNDSAPARMLNMYLLDNPNPGFEAPGGLCPGDPFEACGLRIASLAQFPPAGQDITIDLGRIDDPNSRMSCVFSNPCTFVMGNQQSVTCSSAVLQLSDYSGTGRSFGFGFYSQAIACTAITLQITIQSLTDATGPQVLTWTIGNIHSPALDFIPDYSIRSGETLRFAVHGSDEDADAQLFYSVDSLPEGASFVDGFFTWTPAASEEGTQQIIFTVSDGVLTDSQTVTVTVSAPTWTEILYDDFETGMGNWIDGGTNCTRYTGSRYAVQGSCALNLQDNTYTSVATTRSLALSGYTAVKVDFAYLCVSMDRASEDFWLQISTDGGSTYLTVKEWNLNDEFINGQAYQESVIITGLSLTDKTRIRFRCDASSRDDDVYIDTVSVRVQ